MAKKRRNGCNELMTTFKQDENANENQGNNITTELSRIFKTNVFQSDFSPQYNTNWQ
jgi:hypothetical protein